MKINLPVAVTTRVGSVGLIAQKNSPKILFGAGLVLFGATVITAAQSTLKLDGVLYDIKAERRDIANAHDADLLEQA